MKNIAVFGGRVDETDRRTLEDGYVTALAAYGVHATPSYVIFQHGPVPPDANAVRTTLERGGYDGALVATMKGVTERVLLPDAAWAWGFYGGDYWGAGANSGAASAVYPATEQLVRFETALWSTDSGKLVWSANTQTGNPKSGKDFISSLTKVVVPSLAKAGVIPSKEGQPVSTLR